MQKNLPNNSLKQLKFCVLGLGDSSYAKYVSSYISDMCKHNVYLRSVVSFTDLTL